MEWERADFARRIMYWLLRVRNPSEVRTAEPRSRIPQRSSSIHAPLSLLRWAHHSMVAIHPAAPITK